MNAVFKAAASARRLARAPVTLRIGINIEDLFTSTYQESHTGGLRFSLHMTVAIHADVAIAAIRGEFMDFCDDRNLDAMLAPVK